MRYPFNEIKAVHDDVKNATITKMAIRLQEAFPALTKDGPFKITDIDGVPEEIAFGDTGIQQDVLDVAVSNLSAFLLSNDVTNISRVPVRWAKDHGDKDSVTFFQHLAKWVKGTDYRSVVNLVYLAHYEAEFRKHRRMDSGNIVLPGADECAIVVQLAEALAKALKGAKVFTYRIDDYAGFNAVVDKGDIDFLVGDTLVISRLGRIYGRDRFYLLICYVLMKQSLKYKESVIRNVSLVSPSDGTCLSVDIRQVDAMVMNIVNDCIYGPVENTVVENTITRKRRVTLVTMLVSLLDAKDNSETVLRELTQSCNAYVSGLSVVHEKVKDQFLMTVDYFSNALPKGTDEEQYYQDGIQLLNQLLVNLESADQNEIKSVRLNESVVQDILHKALDF